MKAKQKRRITKAMTLIELVVTLGILAALSTLALSAFDGLGDGQRVDTTNHKIKQIQHSVIGDGETVGRFINDMGRFPMTNDSGGGKEFLELFNNIYSVSNVTSYTFTPEIISGRTYVNSIETFPINYGWHGPYLDSAEEEVFDGFGNPFEVFLEGGTEFKSIGSDLDTEILRIRSLGRNGDDHGNTDWADTEIVSPDWKEISEATLTVTVMVLNLGGTPLFWASPRVESTVTECADPEVSNQTYSPYEIYTHTNGNVFLCIENADIAIETIVSTQDINLVSQGELFTVVDDEDNSVNWRCLGKDFASFQNQYLTHLKGVLMVPDVSESDCVEELEGTLVNNSITFSNLTPGNRWLHVGGVFENFDNTYSNEWASGVQPVTLRPGANYVTVYLNRKLEP